MPSGPPVRPITHAWSIHALSTEGTVKLCIGAPIRMRSACSSSGYCVNGTSYVSGQMLHDMQGAFVGEGDIEAQTRQTHENIDRVLAGFGVTRTNIAEMQIFMIDPQREQERFIPCTTSTWETIGRP